MCREMDEIHEQLEAPVCTRAPPVSTPPHSLRAEIITPKLSTLPTAPSNLCLLILENILELPQNFLLLQTLGLLFKKWRRNKVLP